MNSQLVGCPSPYPSG